MSTISQKELEDLLVCLKGGGENENSTRLKENTHHEWMSFVSFARQCRVTPFLYHKLKQWDIQPPKQVQELLKQDFLRNTAHNIRLYRELGILLNKLAEQKIPVILLKGAFLAEVVYDNIGLRPMTDLDILVHAVDVEKAITLMEEIGFRADHRFRANVDGELHFHAPIMDKAGRFLELHWNLTSETNLSIDLKGLWERRQQFYTEGGKIWSLGWSDQLVHLAVHAAYGHQFHDQLLSLIDITEIIQKYQNDLNWEEITDTCEAWQANRGTYLALRLVCDLFDMHLPDGTLERIKPSDWTEELLISARGRLFNTDPDLSENYIHLMEGKNPTVRLRGLLQGLFPPRKVMAMMYGLPTNSWQILTKYPGHIRSRIKRYWKPFIQRLGGDKQQQNTSIRDQSLRDWLGNKNSRG